MGYNKLHEIQTLKSQSDFLKLIILTAVFLCLFGFDVTLVLFQLHEDSLRCWHGIYWDLFLEFSPLLYRTVWLEAVWKRARKGQDWKVPQAGTQTQVAWSTTCVFFHFINNTFKYNILCGDGKVAQWVSLLPQIKKVPGSKPGGLSVWSLHVLSVLALGCFPFPHNLKTWRVGHPPLTSSWDIGIGFSIPASLQYDKWYENGWKDALLTNLDYFTNLEVPLEPEGNIYVMISWMS